MGNACLAFFFRLSLVFLLTQFTLLTATPTTGDVVGRLPTINSRQSQNDIGFGGFGGGGHSGFPGSGGSSSGFGNGGNGVGGSGGTSSGGGGTGFGQSSGSGGSTSSNGNGSGSNSGSSGTGSGSGSGSGDGTGNSSSSSSDSNQDTTSTTSPPSTPTSTPTSTKPSTPTAAATSDKPTSSPSGSVTSPARNIAASNTKTSSSINASSVFSSVTPTGSLLGSTDTAGISTVTNDPGATGAAFASSHSNTGLLAGILVALFLILLLAIAAVVVYRRRRARRDNEWDDPMTQTSGGVLAAVRGRFTAAGGGTAATANRGIWSQLDMASRGDLTVPSPTGPSSSSFSTLSPAPSLAPSSPSAQISHLRDSSSIHLRQPSPAPLPPDPIDTEPSSLPYYAPTQSPNHLPPPPVPVPVPEPEPTIVRRTTLRSSTGHGTTAGHDAASIFAVDSPFTSGESPLHWQDEPALAESRPNSMDSPLPVADDPRWSGSRFPGPGHSSSS